MVDYTDRLAIMKWCGDAGFCWTRNFFPTHRASL